MKRFVDSQTQFVGDTLSEAQPMQAIAKERRDVGSASAAEDESRGRVQKVLLGQSRPYSAMMNRRAYRSQLVTQCSDEG